MIAKTAESRVRFFAATAKMAMACGILASQNKRLASSPTFEELSRLPRSRRRARNNDVVVVLSHVDDECAPLTDRRADPILANAFFVLFTEATTHPEQVAGWMRSTRIQSEDRLHVVKLDKFEPSRIAEIVRRYRNALGNDDRRGGIIDAFLVGDTLFVRGRTSRMLRVPVSAIDGREGQPRRRIENFQIDPDGSFLYWPELDAHLGWNQFLQIVDPAARRKAQQRSSEFNICYGAAIRKLREQAAIPQSKIPGLTDRQLRRIEQGECRATTKSLAALAKAHGLTLDDYLDRLAKAMK